MERFLGEFRERLAKFGLELHAEKTRLIEFGRYAAPNREKRGEGTPETFTFLGFTHYCGKRRKDGAFIVRRETAKKRLVAKLQAIKTELKRRRHEPVASVGAWLQKVSSGYYQYHAVPGNLDRLQLFRWRLRWVWYRALSRRSQRSRVSMDRLNRIIDRWIPAPRVLLLAVFAVPDSFAWSRCTSSASRIFPKAIPFNSLSLMEATAASACFTISA